MFKQIGVLAIVFCCVTALQTQAQYYREGNRSTAEENDKVSLGIGAGFDYGGIGANVLVYPHNNLGFFAAGGYALAGFGYNVGVKARLTASSKFHPYLTAMYGYNTSIVVSNATQFNKIFYGTTFGFGVDFRSRSNRYFTLGLLIPVRGSDVDNYMNQMKSMGVSFSNSLPPVGLSIGYRFVLQ
jgi:hypothetical protein